jgi:hypothetical protein
MSLSEIEMISEMLMRQFILAGICVVAFAVSAPAQNADKQATIAFVLSLQTSNGGFLVQTPQPNVRLAPNLRATSAAVRSLHYLGGELPNKAACRKFVESCYDADSGGFANFPGGEPDVFTTAVGVMALPYVDLPMDKYGPRAAAYLGKNAKGFEDLRIAVAGFETIKKRPENYDAWLQQIEQLRNADGSYGKEPTLARDTGGAVVAVLRLGGKLDKRDNVVKVLKEGQRPNGGYGKEQSEFAADLETTYRVTRAFVMLKALPDDVEGVRSFVLKCRNEDGGYAVVPGQPSTMPATYYAAIIRHWLKEE